MDEFCDCMVSNLQCTPLNNEEMEAGVFVSECKYDRKHDAL